jgi:hypothetical protein
MMLHSHDQWPGPRGFKLPRTYSFDLYMVAVPPLSAYHWPGPRGSMLPRSYSFNWRPGPRGFMLPRSYSF